MKRYILTYCEKGSTILNGELVVFFYFLSDNEMKPKQPK